MNGTGESEEVERRYGVIDRDGRVTSAEFYKSLLWFNQLSVRRVSVN